MKKNEAQELAGIMKTIPAMRLPEPTFWDGFHNAINDVSTGFMVAVNILVAIYICL